MPVKPPVHRPDWAQIPRTDLRQSASRRGYDGTWRKLRLAYLAQNPLCLDCTQQGRVTAAEEVHHEKTIQEAPHLRLDWSNLRALCHRCHSRRTATTPR